MPTKPTVRSSEFLNPSLIRNNSTFAITLLEYVFMIQSGCSIVTLVTMAISSFTRSRTWALSNFAAKTRLSVWVTMSEISSKITGRKSISSVRLMGNTSDCGVRRELKVFCSALNEGVH